MGLCGFLPLFVYRRLTVFYTGDLEVMPNECRSIAGVEVFSAGTWNGDTYSVGDLDLMVAAFEVTSKTLRPPLKLGHTDKQTLAQKDGMPAVGWVGRLYRQGGKLIADFIDIPGKIFDLLEKGAYKKVSSEIYWNISLDGMKYSRFLGAVALLGADMPAVTNLRDIISFYGLRLREVKYYSLRNYEPRILEGDLTMTKFEKFSASNAGKLDQRDYDLRYQAENMETVEELAKEADYHSEIEEYMLKRGCSYRDAYSGVLKKKRLEKEKKAVDEKRSAYISDAKARLR